MYCISDESTKKGFQNYLKFFFGSNKKDLSYEQLLELFVHWTSESRKYGILSLEQQLDKIQDEFLLRGMKFVIDGVSAEDLEQILESELEAIEERHAKGAAIFSQVGYVCTDIRSFRCCYRSCSCAW